VVIEVLVGQLRGLYVGVWGGAPARWTRTEFALLGGLGGELCETPSLRSAEAQRSAIHERSVVNTLFILMLGGHPG
jgi:hypothetical protein